MEKNSNTTAIIIVIALIIIIGGIFVFSRSSDKDDIANTATTTQNEMQNEDTTHENGVMVGDAMMTPNRDIVDNASDASNVTTLVTAIKAAGLVDTLKGPGPFTVFAPNNDAFNKLPAGTVENLLKPENKDQLVDLLTYHVVAGRYTSADLTDGMTLTTVEGKTIKIGNVNGVITVNGTAMVETPDVISSNGVTFVINEVLMPK